jgi:hypothetical protein
VNRLRQGATRGRALAATRQPTPILRSVLGEVTVDEREVMPVGRIRVELQASHDPVRDHVELAMVEAAHEDRAGE